MQGEDRKRQQRLEQKARHRARHRKALAAKQLARYYAEHEANKAKGRAEYAELSEADRQARWAAVKSDPIRLAKKQASDRKCGAARTGTRAAYYREWRKNGGTARRTARHLERLRTEPNYRLKHAIGCQLRQALKRDKGRCVWSAILGYTPAELRAHLEHQFEPWMTWENYGSAWHIDHRRPIASFTLPDEVRECWALSNLRPLEAIANMRKGKRIELEAAAGKLLDKVA